jgi:hypothetical protein
VTLAACPACGGPLAETRVDCAYTTELAERPRTTVTQYRVWVCRGTVCGRRVRGQHPEVAPDQVGATAHRLGARAMAAAHVLHYGIGGPVLRFLTDPRVPPTKNGAERALRPAVIARKVSHCSKNGTGAHAFQAFTSVVRTLAKQGIDALVENLYQLFQAPSIQGVPL